MVRLQKYLADAGVCSRRKGEQYIRAGRVSVNGRVVTILGTRVDPETDRVELDGKPVYRRVKYIYAMLNKPAGYITSCRHYDKKVVLDLVDIPERIYPVGRLDRDSTGLLLLTNDGRLHQRLCHPSYDHEKEYLVTVNRPIDDRALARMSAGVPLNGRMTRKAHVERISPDTFSIVLREGRKRQIRRMCKYLGYRVTRLHRVRVANIELGELPSGRWRYLKQREVKDLLGFCGIAEIS